jgi:hypothetical protein
VGGSLFVLEDVSRPVDPGYGGGWAPVDPGYGQGHPFPDRPDNELPGGRPDHPWFGGRPDRPDNSLPGSGHPGNALPIPPVRPSPPIVLPPGMWPPTIPPGGPSIDNELPGGRPDRPSPPIVIPPNPDIGIELPIYLPSLPPGTALLIALTGAHVPTATPTGVPAGHKPAILVQSGKKPVLVYVSAVPVATPK